MEYLTLRQIAKRMGMNETQLYTMKHRYADFPPPRMVAGTLNLYDQLDIEAWLEARKVAI